MSSQLCVCVCVCVRMCLMLNDYVLYYARRRSNYKNQIKSNQIKSNRIKSNRIYQSSTVDMENNNVNALASTCSCDYF